MFEFIKKLFGQKKEEPESLTLDFSQLGEWCKEESEKELEELRPLIKDIYTEIETILNDLDRDREQLLDAEPVETADKRMEKVGDSNRDNIVDNLKMVREKISIPQTISLQGSYSFYVDTKATMNTFLDNARKSMIYAKALYPEEYRQLDDDLDRMHEQLSSLFSTIKDSKNKLDTINDIFEEMDYVNKLMKEIEESRSAISNLELKKANIEVGIKEKESEFQELVNGPEYSRAKELEKEIEHLKSQKFSVASDIDRMFTPVSKALSRMQKQDDNKMYSLSSEKRSMVDTLVNDPVSAMEFDLEPLYNELIQRIEDGSLGLKDKKKEKTLEQLERLKSTNELSDLCEKMRSFDSKIEELENELDQMSVYNQKKRIETDIGKKQTNLKSVQEDIENATSHLHHLEQKLEDTKQELDSNVNSAFEQNIEIKYN